MIFSARGATSLAKWLSKAVRRCFCRVRGLIKGDGLKLKSGYCFGVTFLGILLSPSWLFASEKWVGVDLGGGYQLLGSSIAGQNDLKGAFILGDAVFEFRKQRFGDVGFALGFQQTWQEGLSATRSQKIQTRLPFVDVNYSYPVLAERLYAGLHIRNMLGAGSHYDISDLTSFQWLFAVGPRVEYRIPVDLLKGRKTELVLSASALRGLGASGQSLWQFPIGVGIRFPWNLSRAEVSDVAPYSEPETVSQEVNSEDIARGQVAQLLADGVKVTLPVSRVYFGTGQATVDENGGNYLSSLSSAIAANQNLWEKVEVSGHTDSRGRQASNQQLSLKRANTVLNSLVQAGVDSQRLEARGAGALEPIDERDNELGWKWNRRVELKIKAADENRAALAAEINKVDLNFKD